jgi:hypothetical protein
MEVSGQIHAPVALPPGKKAPTTQWIGERVGSRAGLDAVVIKVKLFCALTDQHTMKAYWGSGGIAPRIIWPRH